MRAAGAVVTAGSDAAGSPAAAVDAVRTDLDAGEWLAGSSDQRTVETIARRRRP